MNIAWNHFFLRIFNKFSEISKIIYREEIDDFSFTGCYSDLTSYLKTVLESWISRQKWYHCHFYGFTFFHVEIIIWILKSLIKIAKLSSKVQIAVKTSWLNCKPLQTFCYSFHPSCGSIPLQPVYPQKEPWTHPGSRKCQPEESHDTQVKKGSS